MSLILPDPFPPPWACEWADDAQWGISVTLSIGGVRQRFRWIQAGTFQMGSPQDEADRSHGETLREVTLACGYWLADTACTQALWQVVMGANPSRFQEHPANPVEQVNWDDVQTFLDRLNALVPGLDAGLPSEAQWEYACRAGTIEPFSFGEYITRGQVNYNGKYPYVGAEKDLQRGKTVPVGSLPPNSWGLYEMHGNVWEWCADAYAPSIERSQTEPSGPPDGSGRVLRGGSWGSNARSCRSAYRHFYRPGVALYYIGFRIAVDQRPVREEGRLAGSPENSPP